VHRQAHGWMDGCVYTIDHGTKKPDAFGEGGGAHICEKKNASVIEIKLKQFALIFIQCLCLLTYSIILRKKSIKCDAVQGKGNHGMCIYR